MISLVTLLSVTPVHKIMMRVTVNVIVKSL
jgi:hypothetical protein